eukprot:4381689-Alexandrium_andersonii.AAC.1
MSASLVGSEMCIRDRQRPVPQRPVPQKPVPQKPVPQRPVPQRPVPQRPVPVSYTHLTLPTICSV